jgi:hypothetical protein
VINRFVVAFIQATSAVAAQCGAVFRRVRTTGGRFSIDSNIANRSRRQAIRGESGRVARSSSAKRHVITFLVGGCAVCVLIAELWRSTCSRRGCERNCLDRRQDILTVAIRWLVCFFCLSVLTWVCFLLSFRYKYFNQLEAERKVSSDRQISCCVRF